MECRKFIIRIRLNCIVEWRFDKIIEWQDQKVSFDLNLINLIPGEDRIVDHSLELIYKDLNDQEVKVDLPPFSVHVFASAFTSTLTTDRPAYQANEDVVVRSAITNLSDYARMIDAKVVIEDKEGNAVQELASFIGLSFAVGETKDMGNLVFHIGDHYAGDYRAHLVLLENQNRIGEAFAGITILPTIAISSKVTTDKISYNANESVAITSSIVSTSTNYVQENLTATMTIGADGTSGPLLTETKTISNLLPGAAYTFKSYWNTATNPTGTYLVSLEVKDSNGTVLATATQNLVITNVVKLSAALKGLIAVDKPSLLSGDPVSVSYSVTNVGNSDFADVALSVQIVHVVNQTVYDNLSSQATLTMGGTYTGSGTFDTTTYSAMDYLVVLRANINGVEETLAGTYFRVEGAPTAPALISPAMGSDVDTVTPALLVSNASDPNDDTLTYEFELYADAGLSQLLASSGLLAEGTGTTAWTAPFDLTENATYYWRARAYDGKLYGPWMDKASFRVNVMNEPPTAPVPLSPADTTSVPVLTPVLTVTNASDPDSTNLTYNFQVALDPDFTEIAAKTIGVLSSQGTTSWQVDPQLSENTWYYWRAQADDWLDVGPWSVTAKFFVNTTNDKPTVPVILSPVNDATVTNRNVDIVLENSTDIDSPVISYLFEVDTIPTFDSGSTIRSGIIPPGPGSTTWQAIGLLDNTEYYARAMASDGSAGSDWSDQRSFFVNTANDAPTTPVIANPSNGAGVKELNPLLSVHNATDVDRDTLTYEFEVCSDAACTSRVDRAEGIVEAVGTTSWTVTVALTENQTYYWRARAYDGSLNSGWAEGWFVVNKANDAPEAPKLLSPTDGSTVDTLTPTFTVVNAKDPDSDTLTYSFEVYNGSTLIWSITGVSEGTAGNTSVTIPTALSNNTAYQWQCKASDGDREGPWTAKATFTVHMPQTGITADLRIEPETLNQKSKGNWVMAEIALPHGYKTSDVDISSIRLEGTVPAVAWPYEQKKRHLAKGCDADPGAHEHGAVKVKFSRSAVIAVLPQGDHVPVHVTGMVGATTFEGVDIIRVIH